MKNNKRKVIGWKLNEKGKKNFEILICTIFGLSTLGYVIMGFWLLYFVTVGGNI